MREGGGGLVSYCRSAKDDAGVDDCLRRRVKWG